MKKYRKICVYAICKNELKFINKWLNSMSEADYIVVLDTGSTDGTYETLKEDPRVTKVEQKEIKPWRFDVARNESMKLVPEDADILVCTDFDEVFENNWANILRNGWEKGTTRATYNYAWSHSGSGDPQDVFKYDKIHTKDYHWVYPVHEVVVPNNPEKEKRVEFGDNIYLHHYQDLTKPRGSYLDLLKLSVSENPNDSHIQFLFAREFCLRQDWNTALEETLKILDMPDSEDRDNGMVLRATLLQLVFIYENLKDYDEAIWYCQEFVKVDSTYREPYFFMAEMYNQMKMYTLATAMVEAGFKYGVRKYNWVEHSNSWLGWGNDILSVSQFMLENIDDAIENVQKALKYEPNEPRLLKNYNGYLQKQNFQLKQRLNAEMSTK